MGVIRMEYDIYDEDGVTVAKLSGELNANTSDVAYETIISKLDNGGAVILDMERVSYMSSAGIRTLLLLYRNLTERSGKIVLVGLNDALRDTLDITGFLEYFEVQPSLEAARRVLK
jgi:anti-sigma B factor antagonist